MPTTIDTSSDSNQFGKPVTVRGCAPCRPDLPFLDFPGGSFALSTEANPVFLSKQEGWDDLMHEAAGQLVGPNYDLNVFLEENTSELSDWQQVACNWALANPEHTLIARESSGSSMVSDLGVPGSGAVLWKYVFLIIALAGS